MIEPVEVTLGTPFYNSEVYLKDYFGVLGSMTYPKDFINLKLIDNGSTDKTLACLVDYADNHHQEYQAVEVGIVSQEDKYSDTRKERWNIINVRNQILDKARGHIVMMDSDVIPPADFIEILLELIRQGAGIGGGLSIVVTGLLRDPKTGRELRYVPQLTAWTLHLDNTYRSIGAIDFNRPHIAELAPEHINSILRVDTIGTGLCIINQVLKDLRFQYNAQYGEDFHFCQMVDKLGYPILVHTGLWYDHTHYLYQKIDDGKKFLIVFKGIERSKGAAFVKEAKIVGNQRKGGHSP